MSFGLGSLVGPNIHLSQAASLPSIGQNYGESKESQPGSVLRLLEDICRVLRGARITSCKSAKDRTGMAVTLEESRLLAQFEAGVIAGTSMALAYLSSKKQQQQQLVILRAAGNGNEDGSVITTINSDKNRESSLPPLSPPPPALIAAFLLRSVYAIPTGSIASRSKNLTSLSLSSWPWPGKFSSLQWAGDPSFSCETTAAAAGAISSQKAILSQYFKAAFEGVSSTWPSLGPSGSAELVSVAIGAQHSSRLAGFINGTAAFLAEPAVRGYLGSHASLITASRQLNNNNNNTSVAVIKMVTESITKLLYTLSTLEAEITTEKELIHSLELINKLRTLRIALASLPVQPLSMRIVAGDTGVRAAVMDDILGCAGFLREYGTRLGNAEKNTGKFQFAFNAFQRAFFPLEFRAPLSVIGSSKHS